MIALNPDEERLRAENYGAPGEDLLREWAYEEAMEEIINVPTVDEYE